jgi:hypothetical protein
MEKTRWHINEYNKWIQNGCPLNEHVLEIYISDSNLTSLVNLQNLVNLQVLNCSGNNLTNLNGIQNLINLKKLYCYYNQLTDLKDVQNLVNLQILICHFNNLTTLNGIQNLINLQKLDCMHNKLTTLNNIQNLVNLKELFCVNNKLVNLNGVQYLINLQYLDCSRNQLINLNCIQNLVNLQTLYCMNNNLTTLNDIQNLRNLRHIKYYGNQIEHIPPNITRMLNQIKNGQNIYGDSQNVHNHHIQESIRQSIFNILQTKPTITNINQLIINDTILTEQTKRLLFEYAACKDVHTTLNITFQELLVYVFDRIEQNEHKDEIKRVLNIEMDESFCKCFTGRISRLINCLNGFDPLVSINISDSEQISQIIILIRNELDRTNNYDPTVHKQLVEERLKELKYSNDAIDIWIQNIE